jgi:hypothetical protein
MDIMSRYINDPYYDDDLLLATLIAYMIGGKDTLGTTLPWIFYNLAKYPHVVSSIRDELAPIISRKDIARAAKVLFEPQEANARAYLQPTVIFEPEEVDQAPTQSTSHRAGDTKVVPVDPYRAQVCGSQRCDAEWP